MFYLVIKNGRIIERMQSRGTKVIDTQQWRGMVGNTVEAFIRFCERYKFTWHVLVAKPSQEEEKRVLRLYMEFKK